MADFSSTKKDATKEEWVEQLECMVELNGYSPAFIPEEWEQAYEEGEEVSDFFYANYDPDED